MKTFYTTLRCFFYAITGVCLFALFSLDVSAQCTHTIVLTDTFGDGWNGGTVTVNVNGSPVLSNITLSSGAGPSNVTFSAATGSTITVIRTAAGSYSYEMRIQVTGPGGTVIALQEPIASPGISGTGSCGGGGGGCTHTIVLTDTFGDGWNGGTVTVNVNGSPVLSNITLSSGAGPSNVTFSAATGSTITVIRTAAGSYSYEMRIQVTGPGGTVIALQEPVASPGISGSGNCGGGGGGGCTNTTMYPSTSFAAPAGGTTYNISTCNFAGEYNQMTGAVAGNTFISTASTAGTYITVRAGTYNGAVVANGTTPLSWTATAGGTYFIHYNTNSSCGTASSCITTTIQNTSVVIFNPCTAIANITGCGVSTSASIASGTGIYNPPLTSCGFSTPGQEKIYTFTPTFSGIHQIAQSSSFGYIDYFFKAASGGCSGTGWTCIQDLNGATTSITSTFNLTAGVQYYILLDPEGSGGGSVTFSINCPTLTNDLVCNATAISCGQTLSGTTIGATLSGTGEGLTCGITNTMPGVWYIVTGDGQNMTASLCATSWDSKISVFSGSCSSLTCIGGNDDVGPACASSSASYSWTSVIGVNYYILVHGYSTNSAFNIALTCVSATPAYRASFISMSTGSSNWCAGETRTVSVTVQNTGTATWTNSGPEVNIGVKWNAEADYNVRVDADNLASGNTATYNLTITAPLTTGANNLTFDVVNESSCWFGNNNGVCGPGNSVYISPAISINAVPAAPTSVTASPATLCPPGGTSQLNATSAGNTIRWYTVASAGSNIGTSTSGVNFPVNPGSTTTYYAEAYTAAGCASATRTAVTVTVGDSTPPTINCPSPITTGTPSGMCGAIVNFITPSGSDNCPGASTIQIGGLTSGSTFPVGTTTNTFLVTANNGQTAQCSFTVIVNDTQAPTAICQNVTVTLGAGGTASVSASQVNNGSVDNCGITGTSLSGNTSYTCANIGGTITVTLQVNDAAGYTATCSATVSVNDANGNCCNAPQAICQSAPVLFLNGSGTATLTASQVNNGSTADCGLQSLQVSPTSFTCAHVGTPQTVVLTVTDINNRTSTCQTSLSVQDNTPPTVNCQNYSVNLSGNSASISPSDVYDSGSDNCGTVNLQSVSPSNFNCSNVGTNTVTLTVNDGKGNMATCSATVTVNDATPPDIFCQNISVDLSGSSVQISPSDVYDFGSDNCGTVNLVSVSPNTFTCNNTGSNTVVLTANDGNGNVSTCSATVTVTDVTSPTFTYCPESITVDADESCLGIATWSQPTATDNCGFSVSQTEGSDSGEYFALGTTTVTYLATDDSGLTAECSFTVTVQDVTPPTVACQPGEVAVYLSGTFVTVTPEDVLWYSSDNCGYVYNDSVSPSTFGCSDVGSSHTVTLTVHDGNGNFSTCSASVMVYDNEAPTAVCQGISVDLDASGNVSISAGDINNDSSDNCGLDGVSLDVSDFDCDDVGSNTVTLTATDVNGNTSTCSATVNVSDNTAPSAICQSISVDLDENNSASIEGSDIDDGSNDACGIYSLTAEPNSFDCDDIGENTVTLTVYDNNGNSSVCTATVTVVDTEAPVAVCHNLSVTLDENGMVSISTEDIDNGSSDNCDFDLSLDPTEFTCANQGTNTVTLTATDGSGNTSTCSATVMVGLAYTTSITPSGSTTFCEGESVDLDAGDYAAYQWSANAGSSTDQTVTVNEAGTYSVTVTDENGCTSSAEITVVVNPLPTPEITADGATTFCEGESVGLDAGEYNSYEWNALGGNATTQTITATEGGTYSVTVTDENGCTGAASFEVTVHALPEVSVNGVTNACEGGVIDFTATGGGTYSWSGPNDFSATTANVYFSDATLSLSGVYSVTVTNEYGCSTVYDVTVGVNDAPDASISGNTVVCKDDNLVLIASGGVTYEWSGPNGYTSSGATLFRSGANDNMAGTYTVTVSDGIGCYTVLSTTVSIFGGSFNVSIAGNTNTCVSGNISLTASAIGAVSYLWLGPDGFSSTTASFTRTNATLTMSGTYTVYATNANGCVTSSSRDVTVNSTTASVTGTTNVCVGGSINLIASGGNSYQWAGPNGFISTAHSILRTGATTTMSGVYSVTVSNAIGCTGTANIMVTVHAMPSATLGGTTSICSGGTITITAPAGATSYVWSGPNSFTATGGPSLVRPNANSTMAGQYKVTVTNAGGCTASASRSVTVSAPTTANVTGATSVCSNANVLLTATTAGVAYSWTGPGGFTASTSAISAPPVAGAYLVTVTASAGCISTATRNVTVVAAPNAVITGNLNVCTNGTISLLASGGSNYNWSGPGGYTRVGNSVLRTAATVAMSGTYTVTVTGSGGCKSTASVYVTVAACKNGDEELDFETLHAYPNPTNGVTTITFTALKAEQMNLSVFAVDGREVAVLFNGMTETDTAYEFVLDTNDLPSGTYYTMLRRANGATQQLRLMVVR